MCTSARRAAAASTAAHAYTAHSVAMIAPSTPCSRLLHILQAFCASEVARRNFDASLANNRLHVLNKPILTWVTPSSDVYEMGEIAVRDVKKPPSCARRPPIFPSA